MKTKHGLYLQDASGLWHYQYEMGAGHVNTAAFDAICHRTGPSWFWFNDTPAPIHNDDTVQSLVNRWEDWREANDMKEKVLSLLPRLFGKPI